MEFAEQIMLDLINQGYSGNDLHEHFKEEVNQIRPAVEAILAEAKWVAVSKSGYASYGDVFDEVEIVAEIGKVGHAALFLHRTKSLIF